MRGKGILEYALTGSHRKSCRHWHWRGRITGLAAPDVTTTVQAKWKENGRFSLSSGAVSGPHGSGEGPELGARMKARRRHSQKKSNGGRRELRAGSLPQLFSQEMCWRQVSPVPDF